MQTYQIGRVSWSPDFKDHKPIKYGPINGIQLDDHVNLVDPPINSLFAQNKELIENISEKIKYFKKLDDFLEGEDPTQPIYANPSEFYGEL